MPGELFITGNAPEGNQQLNSQTSAAFSGASIKKGADCIIDEINITPSVIRVIIIGILILILLSSVISSKENMAFHFYIGKMRNFYSCSYHHFNLCKISSGNFFSHPPKPKRKPAAPKHLLGALSYTCKPHSYGCFYSML